MKLKFCSLSSGSSGNCYYLGNEFHGILIDVGISAGSIRRFLKEIGISINSIMGVLISHNHLDHIKGLEVLTRKNHIPIFTTENVWDSMLKQPYLLNITNDCIRRIYLQQRFHLAGFDIEAFPVFHDAPETLGFHICAGNKQVAIVTDLGHICQTASEYIKSSNFLVIESNYDEQMLLSGNYPAFLKMRIKSANGHLSNDQASSFLADNIHDELSHICLAHISKNNNTPDKALQTLHQAFASRDKMLNGRPKIIVLNRNLPTELIRLDE